MHQGIQLELSEIAVIYIHITIHFFQIHAKPVGVVIDKIHVEGCLIISNGFNFQVFQVPVFKTLWWGAGIQKQTNKAQREEILQVELFDCKIGSLADFPFLILAKIVYSLLNNLDILYKKYKFHYTI